MSLLFNEDEIENAAFWCMLMGIISCLFSNITGLFIFLSWSSIFDILNFTHASLAWFSTITFTILFVIRIKFNVELNQSKSYRWAYFYIQTLALSILFYGAHLGAKAAERI